MPVAVIVGWYGPYPDLDALHDVVQSDWQRVPRALYMALAHGNKYQYVGLTEKPPMRINRWHPQLKHEDNERFYIGQIVTQGITGHRNGRQPPDLSLAEHALVRFLQPALNTDKKVTEPGDCVSIFSCFYQTKDYEPATNPLPKFPKVLAYNSYTQQWFTEAR